MNKSKEEEERGGVEQVDGIVTIESEWTRADEVTKRQPKR
jgi:hypothetical protein